MGWAFSSPFRGQLAVAFKKWICYTFLKYFEAGIDKSLGSSNNIEAWSEFIEKTSNNKKKKRGKKREKFLIMTTCHLTKKIVEAAYDKFCNGLNERRNKREFPRYRNAKNGENSHDDPRRHKRIGNWYPPN